MADIGRILGGLGAAVGGTAPQFRQQMMKEDEMARTRALQDEEMAEKRRATMFVDAKAANDMLQRGDLQGFKSIYQDRLDILGNMPNVDTSHTRRALGLADAALQGDRNALEALSRENQNTVRAGTSYGILQSPAPIKASSGDVFLDPNTLEPIYTAPTEDKSFDRESDFRKEFNALPQVKDFATRSAGLGTVLASATDPSPAGDISLIFAFMKMLDPTSVVREGEFATAQSAGSIPESIWAKYNQALEGTRLAPTVRDDFVDRAQRIYNRASEDFGKTYKRYEAIATRSGLNPNSALIDYRAASPESQLPVSAVEAGVLPEVWELMTSEEQALFN